MSGSFVGVVVEGLVATLLVVTIVYCVRLNRKLERLRADETDMKNLVGDLIEATTNAGHSVAQGIGERLGPRAGLAHASRGENFRCAARADGRR